MTHAQPQHRPPHWWHQRLLASTRLLASVLDVVHEKVVDRPPAWALDRGWTDYLVGLAEEVVERAELHGIAATFVDDPCCPPSLRRLADEVEAVCSVPSSWARTSPCPDGSTRGASARKQRQIEAMLWAQGMLGRAFRRVVDVGAGHGHLTRRVSAHLGVEALGLESDPERVEMARTLSAGARVEVVEVDVLGPDVAAQLGPHLGLSAEVLAMSLHGCGALADVLVRAAVEAQADVLLVACCPQKIRAPWRQPVTCLVHDGLPNLQLPREVLGLGNVLSRAEGIERPLASELATRQVRHALRYVLAARGLDVSLGEAMRGVNRRRAHGGLAALAAAALAVRGLSPPTADELTQATERARVSFPAARRLALPRSMLGRLLEVHLALDRAAYLEQAGYHVWVVELFPSEVSPRNLAIVGRAPTTTTTATTTTMATTTTTLAG